MRDARLLAGALAAVFLTGACTTEGLAFIQDRRVEITAPGYRERVDFPVTVDWALTSEGLEDDLGSELNFGVYVDIDPQPPGESLEYFARNDQPCLESPTCPDTEYLERRGIYSTSETEMTFESLPLGLGVDLERGDRDFHDVTLILLDESGVRVGESAWHIIFEIDRGEN